MGTNSISVNQAMLKFNSKSPKNGPFAHLVLSCEECPNRMHPPRLYNVTKASVRVFLSEFDKCVSTSNSIKIKDCIAKATLEDICAIDFDRVENCDKICPLQIRSFLNRIAHNGKREIRKNRKMLDNTVRLDYEIHDVKDRIRFLFKELAASMSKLGLQKSSHCEHYIVLP